jgi:molybdopterin-synthase adenylyltransferase
MTRYELDYLKTRELSVAMTGDVDQQLRDHFAHVGVQEDLTFAIWRPGCGRRRLSMIVNRLLLPDEDERILDGNVAFTSDYLGRVLAQVEPGDGVALIHSHLGPGWQGMSRDDVVAERDRLAGAVSGRTELPLLGMTWGTDGTWSARVWGRSAPFTYERADVSVVRVIRSDRLDLSFRPVLRPEPPELPAQVATLSVWGAKAQADIARARVGIVGLGSVGSIISEGLSRMGVSDIVLIDHDRIESRNLDRTLHATGADVEAETFKVDVARRGIVDSHTAVTVGVDTLTESLLTRAGVEAALDCDVLISSVDRPWPRWILNAIAYGHLIPVVDGGIFARTTAEGRPLHIDWRIHTVGSGRACMVCLGALLRSDVGLDRDGLLDDPDYIGGLTPVERERYARRNVFAFSLAVAGHQLLHLVGLIAGSSRVSGIGPQHYQAYPGTMSVEATASCSGDCEIAAITASAQPLADQFE